MFIFNNLKFFLQIIVLSPLIILIILISPIIKVRIGKIKSKLIGHLTTPMEIFIAEKNAGLFNKNYYNFNSKLNRN